MDSDRAELSALATTLDDLATRITAVGDRYRGSTRPDVADGLYEVERSLLPSPRDGEARRRPRGAPSRRRQAADPSVALEPGGGNLVFTDVIAPGMAEGARRHDISLQCV